jgi:hypothetical protein
VREGSLLNEAVEYCKKQGLQFYAVNMNYPEEELGTTPRKLNADLYIDDKNIGGLPDWGVIYNRIKSGNSVYENTDPFLEHNDKSKRKKNFFTTLGEIWDRAKEQRY